MSGDGEEVSGGGVPILPAQFVSILNICTLMCEIVKSKYSGILSFSEVSY